MKVEKERKKKKEFNAEGAESAEDAEKRKRRKDLTQRTQRKSTEATEKKTQEGSVKPPPHLDPDNFALAEEPAEEGLFPGFAVYFGYGFG